MGSFGVDSSSNLIAGDVPSAQRKPRYISRCICAGVTVIFILVLLTCIFMFWWPSDAHTPERELDNFVKVRLFWVRHGLSCANVLQKCSKGPSQTRQLLPTLEDALHLVPGFEAAGLNSTFGLKAAPPDGGDCTVEVVSDGLIPGRVGINGAIVRLHDLYRDPGLTDCSQKQSVEAGRSFLKWLQSKGIKVHFTGSSFLMRALETAHGMFRAPCDKTKGLDCGAIFGSNAPLITPVPYMKERTPPSHSSIAQDNVPRRYDEQQQILRKAYGKQFAANSTFAESWPRSAQQYEKFKAFLAVVLAPSIDKSSSLGAPSVDSFRSALESALPEEATPGDGDKPLRIEWDTGQYETGESFDKKEYNDLDAPELNIVLVGHALMIGNYCQVDGENLNNNAIFEKLYILKSHKSGLSQQSITLRELRGRCSLVMNSPNISLSKLASSDVTACSNPFRVSDFLELQEGASIQDTTCVKGAPESAFVIQPEFL